jgi:hypothetical protein
MGIIPRFGGEKTVNFSHSSKVYGGTKQKKSVDPVHYFCHWLALLKPMGTAVAQWLSRCATNRNVAGPIPDGVIRIFH